MSNVKPPRALGVLLALLGIALVVGGVNYLSLGGNAYFLVIGLGVAASGILLALGKKLGLYFYGITLAVLFVWSVIESGANVGTLLPRIALPLIIGVYVFSGKVRSRLS